jgi:hypothetical protein
MVILHPSTLETGVLFRNDVLNATTLPVMHPEDTSTNAAVPDRRRGRRPVHIAIASVSFVTLLLAAVMLLISPESLQPGQCIQGYGRYASSRGHRRVTVSESSIGTVRIVLHEPWREFFGLTTHSQHDFAEFEVQREWFLCFDEYDRLWLFVGAWNTDWGATRQLKSGGYWPHTQSVLMSGVWFDGPRDLRGSVVVSSTGDWEGVPIEFFDRIPGKDAAVWGERSQVPHEAAALSLRQRRIAQRYADDPR